MDNKRIKMQLKLLTMVLGSGMMENQMNIPMEIAIWSFGLLGILETQMKTWELSLSP